MFVGKSASVFGTAGVMLAYACLAFPDSIGVVAERLQLGGFASSLVFVWFALLSIPTGMLCARFGSCGVASAALLASLPALALMAFGPGGSIAAASGLAMMGAANVVLQVALPSRIAELFGTGKQAGVMTVGLFAKTLCAMCIPWAVALFASRGEWRLVFLAFAVLFLLATSALVRGGYAAVTSRDAASIRSVAEVAKDIPTMLAAVAFAAGVVGDISFNLSVPSVVRERFALGDCAIGTVYAVLFGVKLPVTLLGAWIFSRIDSRRLFPVSVAVALLGGLVFTFSSRFAVYLAGVALFAAGYANVYGFVFGIASPRHSTDRSAPVAALLTMSVAGGAAASPLISALGLFLASPGEAVAVAATVYLLVLSAIADVLSRRSN